MPQNHQQILPKPGKNSMNHKKRPCDIMWWGWTGLGWGVCLRTGTRQPFWVILCRLPEKGRKEIEEIVVAMKEEGQEKKRNRNESEETEEIKTFPHLPLPATRIAVLAQL